MFKRRKTFSNWLTNRYILIIRNEENFAEKSTFSFNYAKLIVFLITIFTIFTVISLYLVNTVLSQWFDPRHANLEANRKIIELSIAVDSLAMAVETKDAYIENIRAIMDGEGQMTADEIEAAASQEAIAYSKREAPSTELNPVDSIFRKSFEDEGLGVVGTPRRDLNELQEIFFFSPISGIVTSGFDNKIEHYGVDIVSKSNEPVKAAADGTVIFSSWTQDSGYVIAVQHRSNLITIYKHNSALLKKVGNFVKAGDIVSIIGNTGELTTGPHLHFELWFNGNPVDPEEFVSF